MTSSNDASPLVPQAPCSAHWVGCEWLGDAPGHDCSLVSLQPALAVRHQDLNAVDCFLSQAENSLDALERKVAAAGLRRDDVSPTSRDKARVQRLHCRPHCGLPMPSPEAMHLATLRRSNTPRGMEDGRCVWDSDPLPKAVWESPIRRPHGMHRHIRTVSTVPPSVMKQWKETITRGKKTNRKLDAVSSLQRVLSVPDVPSQLMQAMHSQRLTHALLHALSQGKRADMNETIVWCLTLLSCNEDAMSLMRAELCSGFATVVAIVASDRSLCIPGLYFLGNLLAQADQAQPHLLHSEADGGSRVVLQLVTDLRTLVLQAGASTAVQDLALWCLRNAMQHGLVGDAAVRAAVVPVIVHLLPVAGCTRVLCHVLTLLSMVYHACWNGRPQRPPPKELRRPAIWKSLASLIRHRDVDVQVAATSALGLALANTGPRDRVCAAEAGVLAALTDAVRSPLPCVRSRAYWCLSNVVVACGHEEEGDGDARGAGAQCNDATASAAPGPAVVGSELGRQVSHDVCRWLLNAGMDHLAVSATEAGPWHVRLRAVWFVTNVLCCACCGCDRMMLQERGLVRALCDLVCHGVSCMVAEDVGGIGDGGRSAVHSVGLQQGVAHINTQPWWYEDPGAAGASGLPLLAVVHAALEAALLALLVLLRASYHVEDHALWPTPAGVMDPAVALRSDERFVQCLTWLAESGSPHVSMAAATLAHAWLEPVVSASQRLPSEAAGLCAVQADGDEQCAGCCLQDSHQRCEDQHHQPADEVHNVPHGQYAEKALPNATMLNLFS